MKVWHELSEVPSTWGPSAVAIGKFDGVHLGHQKILERLVTLASERKMTPTLVTLDRHPSALFAPEKAPLDILSSEHWNQEIEQTGIAGTLVLRFDEALAALSPREFISNIVVDTLHAQAVLVGHDFKFGAQASGDVATLRELGEEFGFTVVLMEDVAAAGDSRVSASRIREEIAAGNVAHAALMLGKYPQVQGEVVHGRKRGRELGFPTANIAYDPAVIVPGDGVYAGWFTDAGKKYPCAISVGTNPTFDDVLTRTVEAYLLDENIDLYGHVVTVEFVSRIRGMVAFSGIDDLVVQMHEDVRITRELLTEQAS